MSSVVEKYDYKNLKITLGYKSDRTAYASVLLGQRLLKFFTHDTIEDVKNEVRTFLKDPEQIRKIIKEKHAKFLRQQGIDNPEIEKIGLKQSTSSKRHRASHCWACRHPVDNFIDFECSACGWIICFCGACGCSYGSPVERTT